MEENKQENMSNIEKRNTIINQYIRRQGVIKSKYPNIFIAPADIRNEYICLNTLIDCLRTSQRQIWGQTISSDGCQIDKFVAEKYENALAEFSRLNRENKEFSYYNADYITPEEEAKFEFPEINFEELREKVQAMKTAEDYHVLCDEIVRIGKEPMPEETRAKLYEIQTEMAAKKLKEETTQEMETKELKEEGTAQEVEVPVIVNESKFAEIYGKAKGKIQEVLGKIKTFFKEKSHNKSNDNKELDGRE